MTEIAQRLWISDEPWASIENDYPLFVGVVAVAADEVPPPTAIGIRILKSRTAAGRLSDSEFVENRAILRQDFDAILKAWLRGENIVFYERGMLLCSSVMKDAALTWAAMYGMYNDLKKTCSSERSLHVAE